jgi:hypothetical protein
MNVNVEIITGSAGILSYQTGLVRFIDRLLQVGCFIVEFPTDINVGYLKNMEVLRIMNQAFVPALAFIALPATRQPSTNLCGS